MISNDERRKIATKLRELADANEGYLGMNRVNRVLRDGQVILGTSGLASVADVLRRHADLIWPVSDHDSYCPECGGAFRKEDATEQTCKIESCEEFDERGIWTIELSCGHADVYCVMRPNYCSCCGAKVIE